MFFEDLPNTFREGSAPCVGCVVVGCEGHLGARDVHNRKLSSAVFYGAGFEHVVAFPSVVRSHVMMSVKDRDNVAAR
jgi:hypothetical protein